MSALDAFTLMVLFLASSGSLAVADSVQGRFNVIVRQQSAAQVKAPPVRAIGRAVPNAPNTMSLRLFGSEAVRLRLEVIDPTVRSIEISGLGNTFSLGKDPVEVTLQRRGSRAERAVEISYVIHYRHDAVVSGRREPLQLTLMP